MDIDYPDTDREGYCTPDNSHWICRQCFDDFQELFQFKSGDPNS
jgi:hypothetical protein